MSKIAAWAAIGAIAIAGLRLAQDDKPTRTAAAERSPSTIGEACQQGIRCERPALEIIRHSDWGARWPFTVDEAVVACYRPLKAAGQMVVVDGNVWAANGLTGSMGRQHGLTLEVAGRRRAPLPFDVDDPIVDRLWAFEPKPKGIPDGVVWDARVNWAPIIAVAQRLGCEL